MLIPRRILGFGFALFLILVILAVIASLYAMKRQLNPSDMPAVPVMPAGNQVERGSGATVTSSDAAVLPLPTIVTPDTAADDLIDEALADRDDLSAFAEDEAADAAEGSAAINSLNTVYDESENQ